MGVEGVSCAHAMSHVFLSHCTHLSYMLLQFAPHTAMISNLITVQQGQKVWQRPARRRPRFYESESSGEDEEESEDSDDEVCHLTFAAMLLLCKVFKPGIASKPVHNVIVSHTLPFVFDLRKAWLRTLAVTAAVERSPISSIKLRHTPSSC